MAYLAETLPEVERRPSVSVHKISHGQSNPTYLVQCGEGLEYVLRKKPPPPILPSAHSIEREFQVMSCLKPCGFPVPNPLVLCSDNSVIGTPFYIMEYVQGLIFSRPSLPDMRSKDRFVVYDGMAKTLARLHSIQPASIGLESYGRASNYNRRQVERWNKQFIKSGFARDGELFRKMTALYQLLLKLIPEADHLGNRPSISHGDYRLDNIIYDKTSLEVKAVIDWELSTLGDPMADLAYNCLPYYLAESSLPSLAFPSTLPEGIPSEDEYVRMYCDYRHIELPSERDWTFYISLSLFRLGSILAGVNSRSKQGNASSEYASTLSSDGVIISLIDTAFKLVHNLSTQIAPMQANEALVLKLTNFIRNKILPAEQTLIDHAQSSDRWTIHPLQETLKNEAKAQGLWNLWIPHDLKVCIEPCLHSCDEEERQLLLGPGLTNREYSDLAEVMGYSPWASELFNCSAPDTGNMEVLARYGSIKQQEQWLVPLLRGEIRSCFAMTEQEVASSDATNIRSSIALDSNSDSYVIYGRKWWISGACDPRCRLAIFMGKSNLQASSHKQQSMVIVPMPNSKITSIRPLTVFGYDDAPHGHAEMHFDNVRVPAENIILGEGRGFEIAQGRLGPGRLHHCMRLVGMGTRAIDLVLDRIKNRKSFGKTFSQHQAIRFDIARCRIELDAARLVVQDAASALDKLGNKEARAKVSAAKFQTPRTVIKVIDRIIQIFGGAGVSDKFPLAAIYAAARTLRLADGPDNVHLETIAKVEIARSKL